MAAQLLKLKARDILPFDMLDEGRHAHIIRFECAGTVGRNIHTGEPIIDPITVEVGTCRLVEVDYDAEYGPLHVDEWENVELIQFAADDEVTVVRGLMPS